MTSQTTKAIILRFQRDEITEHAVYKRLAQKSTGKNAEILKRISDDELRHYNEWMKYTQTEVSPDKLAIIKYLLFSIIFWLSFTMKRMESGEEKVQVAYLKVSREVPRAQTIF